MTSSYVDQGAGTPVVFLHGVGSAKEGWRQQLETVVSSGFRFLAIDAPGYGGTPLPDAPGFGPHIASVLDCLDGLNIEKAILCGHSLGGMTAQEVMAHAPGRVLGMVLSATSPAFGRSDGDFQKNFLNARIKPFEDGMTMSEFARQFSPKLLGSSATDLARSEIIAVMSSVSIEAYKMAMMTITGFDQRANLSRIDVPTLLISGEQDTNSPAPMMAKMASKIAASEYVELANTGHLAPVENPEAFNRHLMNFLKRIV